MKRWPVFVLIIGLVAAAAFFESQADPAPRPASVADDSVAARLGPVATPDDALSSTWYCAAGTGRADGVAGRVLVIANPTDRALAGTVTAVPGEGDVATTPVDVDAFSVTRLRLSDVVEADVVAAVVELDGGGAVVERQVAGPDGIDHAPCSSGASTRWYFPTGATTRDARETLVIFNPFPNPATVDVSFVTPEGQRGVPGPFRGIAVPPRSVVAREVTVSVQSQVVATVIARSGRVVADRVQTYDGSGAATTDEAEAEQVYAPKGVTITPGVPRAATTWAFPFGAKDADVHERYVVFNPGTEEVEVEVVVSLADPERNGEIDPFRLTVAPRAFEIVDLDTEGRVPEQVDHSAVIVARSGGPIVAERTVDTVDPYPAVGVATSTGSAVASPRWTFAAGGNVPERLEYVLALQNPSARDVTVQVRRLDGEMSPIDDVPAVQLGPFEHRFVRLAEVVDAPDLSLVVLADAPIVAERALLQVRGAGTSLALGVPSPDGLVVLTGDAAPE